MHTTDQHDDLTSRLEALAAHLDAERTAWDGALTPRPVSARPSRRPMALAGAAALVAAAAAGLALVPRDGAAPPAASAAASSPSLPATVPAPTASERPATLPASEPPGAPSSLPPDARPDPVPVDAEPCPAPPADLEVPDVVGLTYDEAEAVMTEAGFRVLIVAAGETTHDGAAVIVDQEFVAPAGRPCWDVVAVTFDPGIDLAP